mmetsp:Transcript_66789/g.159804  ORF Transcript_66789/g.159804 Transcript_66789/m.159804 type:complete len:261 (+) Transcript_66789:1910-2692(+)
MRSNPRRCKYLAFQHIVCAFWLSSLVILLTLLPFLFAQSFSPPLTHHHGTLYASAPTLVLLNDGNSLVRRQSNLEGVFFVLELIWVGWHSEDHLVIVLNLVLLLLDLLAALLVVQEVAGDLPLNGGRVQLQICEHFVQSYEAISLPRIVEDKLLLQLEDPSDGALEHFLDASTLLRVHHLIVAIFKFPVNLQVLYVEESKVLEARLEYLPIFSSFRRQKLDLHLLHELLHALGPFVLVSRVRHGILQGLSNLDVCTALSA